MKKYKTIIIGGGISGIGCAYNLIKNKYYNFKIISPDIGGRIIESDSKEVEYGAYYIMDIYHNTKEFVNIGHRIYSTRIMFHNKKRIYTLFNKKILKNTKELIRFLIILYKFKKHYNSFKKCNLYQSQINCLKNDPYLWSLYHQQATTFIKKHKILNIVYDYMAEVLHGTTFVSIKKLNAFTFLHFSLPLIVPIYEFSFKKEKLLKILKKYFIKDHVDQIKYDNKKSLYQIITQKKKVYYSKNVVVATQPHIAKKLLNIKQRIKGPANAHMFHIIGELTKEWNGKDLHLFRDDKRLLAIAHQANHSFLLYSIHKDLNIKKYFHNYKIIKHKLWKPAFNISGSELLKFNQGKNLYLIGDHNVIGIEPSYIYGKYCANKILGKTRDQINL